MRAARAIVAAVEAPEPPVHLVLGKPAYDLLTADLQAFERELEAWREVTLGTDFPEAQ